VESAKVEPLPPIDPNDEAQLARLAKLLDIEFTPVVEPERHRGGGKEVAALLLWPQQDVRLEALTSYAIEVGESYGDGDQLATLEFRKGNKTLWRDEKPFDPDNLTVTGEMPEAVHQALKVGDTVTWGLFFEPKARKKDVKATFKVVSGAKAAKGIDRVLKRKDLAKQPAPTKELLIGKELQNYRLYSESLVMHLGLARAFPKAQAPLDGIFLALQRLDLKESKLYAAVAPSIRGGRVANERGGGRGEAGTGSIGGGSGAGGNIEVDTRTLAQHTPHVPLIRLPKDLVRPPGAGKETTGPSAGGDAAQPYAPSDGEPTDPVADPHRPTDPLAPNEMKEVQQRASEAVAAHERAMAQVQDANRQLSEAHAAATEADQAVAAAEQALREAQDKAATPTGDDATDKANREAAEAANKDLVEKQQQAHGARERITNAERAVQGFIDQLERAGQEAAAAQRRLLDAVLAGDPAKPPSPTAQQDEQRGRELQEQIDQVHREREDAQRVADEAAKNLQEKEQEAATAREKANTSANPADIESARLADEAASEAQKALEAAHATLHQVQERLQQVLTAPR
jgi:hypothetical protein